MFRLKIRKFCRLILTFVEVTGEKLEGMVPFLKDVDIEKVLVSNKISFGEKNYKYFISYLYYVIIKLDHYT